MRITDGTGYLAMSRDNPQDPYSAWVIEAGSTSSGRRFAVSHNRLLLDTSRTTIEKLRLFSELEIHHARIDMSEDGWLDFARDSRGYLTISYLIRDARCQASAQGQVRIEGEYANAFCRELLGLIVTT